MKAFFALCVLFLLILSIRFFLFLTTPIPFTDKEEISLETRVLSVPKREDDYQTFQVIANNQFRVFVIADSSFSLHYGDTIRLTGDFQIKKDKRGGQWYSVSATEITVTSPSRLLASLIAFQEYLKDRMGYFLSKDNLGLLTGITFGITQPLTPELKEAITATGVSHITVASGMNVTLLSGVLLLFFQRITKKQIAILLAIGTLILYFFFAGAQASILRATIMGGLVLLGGLLGRQTYSLWLLCVAGYLMLLFQPFLLFDVGFQLSFLSTLGILLYQPRIERYVKGIRGISDGLTTLCAQLLTLPILFYTFGQLNLFSLLTNVLVLWMMPILMGIGFISGGVSILSPFLGSLLAVSALPFLWFFTLVVSTFAPFTASVEISSLFFYVGWYVGCLWLYLFLYTRADE